MKIIYLIIFLFFFSFISLSQIKPASCIHGEGLQYYSDVLLGSIGACNCQKTTVYINDFASCNTDDFVLYFEDNFDDVSLDSSKWEIQTWGQGALKTSGNLEYNSIKNVKLENGICYITAINETINARAISWIRDDTILEDGLPNLRTYEYTSANIWTKSKFRYGKYEILCKLPDGKGFWPAFWTFGGPKWNEIDFFDNYAGINRFVTSMGYDYDGNKKASGCNESFGGFDFSKWHTVTCIFEFDKTTWLVDNNVIRVIYRFGTADGKPIECDDEIGRGTYFQQMCWPMDSMSIILNLAIGSGKGPAPLPDNSTPFPSSFEIDYVKFWKRGDSKLLIYPNPFTDNFTVKYEHANSTDIMIDIYNFTGKTLRHLERKKYGKGIYEEILDATNFTAGIYFLVANINGQLHSGKIIKR